MYLVNFCFSLTVEIQSQKISGKYIFSKFYKKIFSTNRQFSTTETGYYIVIGERRGRFGGLRGLSRRNISGGYRGAVCDCFMWAGVPPFMGALPLVALWGALKGFNYSLLTKKKFSVFRFNPATQAFLPSHLGIVCKQPLPSVCRQFRFPTTSENRKTKVFRFTLSAFRLSCYLCG